MVRLLLAIVVCADSASALAGIRYQFTSTRGGTVYVEGDSYRIEYERSDDPVPHDVVISRDDGRTQQALNTESKTFYTLKDGDVPPASTSRLFSLPMVGGGKAERVKVDMAEEPSFETIAGLRTRKYVLRVSYLLRERLAGELLEADVGVTALLWTAPELAIPPLPLPPGSLKTGIDAVDQEIQKKLAGVGFIVKKQISVTRIIKGGPRYTELLNSEVVQVENVKTEPRLFEVPKAFRYEEPVMSGPGVMIRQ